MESYLQAYLIGVGAVLPGVFGVAGNSLLVTVGPEAAAPFLIGASGLALMFFLVVGFTLVEATPWPVGGAVSASAVFIIGATGGVVDYAQMPVEYQTWPTEAWFVAGGGFLLLTAIGYPPIQDRLSLFQDGEDEDSAEVGA